MKDEDGLSPVQMLYDREELLRFVYRARERFVTARATIRDWRDERTADEMRERFGESELYRQVFGRPPKLHQDEPSRHEPENFERVWRIWHERPDRWRQEAELPDGSGTEYWVIDGRSYWSYSPREGAYAAISASAGFAPEFEIEHVFDPESIGPQLEQLEIRAFVPVLHAGREAIRVEATMPGEWGFVPEPLWWGADDYEIVVDAERGVVLRLASRLSGRAFDATEVLNVSFDETFSESTFVLDLPGVEFGEPERPT